MTAFKHVMNVRETKQGRTESKEGTAPNQHSYIKESTSWVKKEWRDHLDSYAPGGVTSSGVDNINDAYRHYMSAAELTRMIGAVLTFDLGVLNEIINSGYSQESTRMDLSNNNAGIASGSRSTSGVENAINFVSDVSSGKVVVIDENTGERRSTDHRDLPHFDGDRLEDRYRPDKPGHDDTPGGSSGSMTA